MASTYTLHDFKYSACATMIRYCLAVRGPVRPGIPEPKILLTEVHLGNKDQLSEEFLLHVNPKGQVPALTSPELPHPLTGTLNITAHLVTLFPSLIPKSHESEIQQVLDDLHTINFYALIFASTPSVAHLIRDDINEKLQGDISPEYRKALEYKMVVHQKEKTDVLKPEYAEAMTKHTEVVMAKIAECLPDDAIWLFGLAQPTAADCHLIACILKMRDCSRRDIIPERLMEYAEAAEQTPEWELVMGYGE